MSNYIRNPNKEKGEGVNKELLRKIGYQTLTNSSKTDSELKKELMEKMNNDYLDFSDRNGKEWDWMELSDFMIRRGWRHPSQCL